MEVKTTRHFERAFNRLPVDIQERAEAALEIFRNNPFDTKLRTHKLSGGLKQFYAVSVDFRTRIVFWIRNEVAFLHDIGDHDMYR